MNAVAKTCLAVPAAVVAPASSRPHLELDEEIIQSIEDIRAMNFDWDTRLEGIYNLLNSEPFIGETYDLYSIRLLANALMDEANQSKTAVQVIDKFVEDNPRARSAAPVMQRGGWPV
jgi:hypothetical protein